MAERFSADIEQVIRDRLESGAYPSEDELFRGALAALELLEQDRVARWESRNRLALEQSAAGLSRPIDDEKVLTRLRERLAREGIFE